MNTSLRRSCLFLAGAIGIALGAGCPNDDDEGMGTGCLSDAECSGDRICDQGMCIFPGETGGTGGPGPKPPGSTDSGGDTTAGGDTQSCSGDATRCEGSSSMSFCDGGQWSTFSCTDVCEVIGFSGASCSEDFCECGQPLSTRCYDGASAFCVCAESIGEQCTNEMFANMYVDCYEGNAPEFACFSDYIYDNTVYCADAVDACL